jgi:mono/diheme cytochrome c family protein
MIRARTILFLTASLFFGSVGISASRADDKDNVVQGQKLFIANNCYLCHGRVGQGGVGPTITPSHLPPLSGFETFVRNPGASAMPPYTTAVLSDGDLDKIWSYLDSIPAPSSTLPGALKRLSTRSSQ